MKSPGQSVNSLLRGAMGMRELGMGRILKTAVIALMALSLASAYAQLEPIGGEKAPITKKILMIASSVPQLPNGRRVGIWVEDFCATYSYLNEKGYDILLATPRGGPVPIDPKSRQLANAQELWPKAFEALQNSVEISERQLGRDFDALFVLGGLGIYFDIYGTSTMRIIVKSFMYWHRPIVAVADGPAALLGARLNRRRTVFTDRRVTGTTKEEVMLMQVRGFLPITLQYMIPEEGGKFVMFPPFQPHVEVDDYLITGQNWSSLYPAAKALVKKLDQKY
jgi:putative intracellular protease/amidase